MRTLRWRFVLKNKLLLPVVAIFIVFGGLFYAQMTAAATYTWDNGGGDGLWSTCTNWSSDVCPGASDIASFTSATTSDSVIDSGFAGSVLGISIASGYTGTITQQINLVIGTSGFVQNDGTFVQTIYTFDTDGSFTLSAGTFETSTGTNAFTRNLTVSASATLTSSSSKIWLFDGGEFDGSKDSTFTYPGVFPATLDINKSASLTANQNYFYLASGTTIINMVSLSGHVGSMQINSGATMHLANNLLNAYDLYIYGALHASTTVDITGNFYLDSGGVFNYDGTNIYVELNYTDNGGTIDYTGVTVTMDGGTADGLEDGTFTYPGVFPGVLDINKSNSVTSNKNWFYLATGTTIPTVASLSGNGASIQINSGAVMHVANSVLNAHHVYVYGALYASSTFNISGSFLLGAAGELYYDGTNIYVELNYTDSGGTFDSSNVTINLDGGTADGLEDSIFTYPGVFPGKVHINKSISYLGNKNNFTLAAGSTIRLASTVNTKGNTYIYGNLKTEGYGFTVEYNPIIYNGGKLSIYSGQTITTPSLNTGSTVEFYGPGTYTTIPGFSYKNIEFSAGTYNLTSTFSVAGNFTNSGATFNQTSGTVTFTGTANTIAGNNTFYNLTKSATAASTLTFTAGNTQTITATTTLTGLDASNRLTLQSSSGGNQWLIEPQGGRDLNYLAISDGNNVDTSFVDCYTGDCIDGGNNTFIYFEPPAPTYRMRGGTRLRGGTKI